VQVPDCGRNPYDLVVADHLLHFTLDSLRVTAQRAGFAITLLSDSIVKKELSLIARPASRVGTRARRDSGEAAALLVRRSLAALTVQMNAARRLASESSRFGIFGTSISATWLYGCLADKVQFFVDEDASRIGRSHMGLPILASAGIPPQSDIFVPLIPEVASSVVRRLARRTVRFHTPPAADVVGALPAI
jgi:hypothetical protein